MVGEKVRRRMKTEERGAVMAEFVILLPLLVIMLFAIIQFGIVFNRVQGLHAAAREGARVGSLSYTTKAEIEARVTDSLTGVTFSTAPITSVTPNIAAPCFGRNGQSVEVNVTADYVLDIPFIPQQTLNLSGDGTFRCEG